MRELKGASGQVPPGRAGSTGRAAIFRPPSSDGSAAEVSAAAAEYLRGIGAETVECCYPDLLGALVGRTMTVPRFLDTLDGGFGMPMATLAWNLVGDIEPLDVRQRGHGLPEHARASRPVHAAPVGLAAGHGAVPVRHAVGRGRPDRGLTRAIWSGPPRPGSPSWAYRSRSAARSSST